MHKLFLMQFSINKLFTSTLIDQICCDRKSTLSMTYLVKNNAYDSL